MATYDDFEKLTWEQLEEFTYGELERATIAEIEQYLADVWPVLTTLSPQERVELKSGILGRTLPPPLLASADEYNKVQEAALALWSRFQSRNRQNDAAWIAVIIAALTYIHDVTEDVTPPQPTTVVIIQQIPEPVRPLLPVVPNSDIAGYVDQTDA